MNKHIHASTLYTYVKAATKVQSDASSPPELVAAEVALARQAEAFRRDQDHQRCRANDYAFKSKSNGVC
jgi:hypothetical protein